MIQVITLAVFVGVLGVSESGPFESQVLVEAGYGVTYNEVSRGGGYARCGLGARKTVGIRAALMATCSIELARRRVSDKVPSSYSSASISHYQERSASGLPIAGQASWNLRGGTLIFLFGTHWEYGKVSMTLQGSDSKGFYKPPVHDWTQDQQLMERFLRYSLARIAGRRLGNVTTSNIAGASIATATCERSNAKFGDLRAWCSAKNWTVTENKDLGVLTVKRGSTFAVIPMGTAWVKWDGATWTKMSDVVMEKEGRVMAPKDVLDRLNAI